MVLANGRPVKSCMTPVRPGMQIQPLDGIPHLPDVSDQLAPASIETVKIPVLIIGGGPAGLSAAIELSQNGVQVLLVDDKDRLGGKLVLQTHRFFGSSHAVYAGTRGIDIAARLEEQIRACPQVEVWLNSTALAVFADRKVGVWRDGETYTLVEPQVLLVASGAREKFLSFKGNTLPGVFGAGAFQTLVNRDLVRPSERLFIVGGGNVGLIAGYHALQAGIQVAGLVEALPECGGYKVHRDKLARMGVPIFTSHTILSAQGADRVESVTIARVDERFSPIPGTEQTFVCDSVLIAVGLDPVNEFYHKAKEFGLPAFAAGDAEEIAEASAAIFSGKIKGREMARYLGVEIDPVPEDWQTTCEILKSKPGASQPEVSPELQGGVGPVFHCTQEIPCDPCAGLCPKHLIHIDAGDIRSTPEYLGDLNSCIFCRRCVVGCPGLAITLVDYRRSPDRPVVAMPYEFSRGLIKPEDRISVVDTSGQVLGELPVLTVQQIPTSDRTWVITVRAPAEYAQKIAGFQVQPPLDGEEPAQPYQQPLADDEIVCRCERVTAGEIRELIRAGMRDVNEIKAVTRAGMGACGSKTCSSLILRLFKEAGIPTGEIVTNTHRPLFVETPLGIFAGIQPETEVGND
jgi:NADPH-dependent 2,4-dienoyl-CoA reductase/sulfur reductase-like enzyme/Fe-S-cluster-containing hydrogenase component 2/bacterioferritin-associated ferredoxin